MAWTTPMTAVADTAFTAAQFNTHVRDNLNETAPGKASTAGQIFVATGANSISAFESEEGFVGSAQNRSSASYGDLSTFGPSITLETGTSAIVAVSATVSNSAGNSSYMSHQISGDTSISPDDSRSLRFGFGNAGAIFSGSEIMRHDGTLTAGSNTFTAKYRVAGGTGTWEHRRILVIPL